MTLQTNTSVPNRIDRIVVSQAVNGEAVGIEHYARMVPMAATTDERLALLEEAWRERAHLLTMRQIAAKLGIEVSEADRDPYWDQVRAAFHERADAGDLAACSVAQDIVLESYAIVLYEAMDPAVAAPLAGPIRKIAAEEREHLAQGVQRLRAAWLDDPDRTNEVVEWANERIARVLATWVRPEPCEPICSVCGMVGGSCAKDDLKEAGVDTEAFQSTFAALYGRSLREAGLPPERVARWLARLIGA